MENKFLVLKSRWVLVNFSQSHLTLFNIFFLASILRSLKKIRKKVFSSPFGLLEDVLGLQIRWMYTKQQQKATSMKKSEKFFALRLAMAETSTLTFLAYFVFCTKMYKSLKLVFLRAKTNIRLHLFWAQTRNDDDTCDSDDWEWK